MRERGGRGTCRSALGGLKLTKPRPMHLQCYCSEKLSSRLAAASLRKHHDNIILHAALKHAVRMQLLATNPAEVVVPPCVKRGEMMALDEKEAASETHTGRRPTARLKPS